MYESLIATERQKQLEDMLKDECNAVGKILQEKVSGVFLKSSSWTSLGDIFFCPISNAGF